MASDFTAKMEEIISNIRTYEKDNIHRAAEILADTVKAGGTLPPSVPAILSAWHLRPWARGEV